MEGEACPWCVASASCLGLTLEPPVLYLSGGLKGLSLHKVKESIPNRDESHCKLLKCAGLVSNTTF